MSVFGSPMGMSEPYRLRSLQSRAVSQENPTGGKGLGGKGRGNGNCRKGAPAFRFIDPGEIKTLCDIEGQGMVRHIWMALDDHSPEALRSYVIRIYWDDAEHPSVEAPVGDFFGMSHGRHKPFMTPWVGMPEGRSFHCYFPMPFARRCRITFHNDSPKPMEWLFYQVDYTLGDDVTADTGRFHAHFRRSNPCPMGQDFQLLATDGGPGVFIGAVIGVNPIGPGWWGEGEIKFYLDGDTQYPTICGTGAEDYLCSGWGMEPHAAIYTGVNHMIISPSGIPKLVSFYRFHHWDPIYFQSDLRIELQQLGAGGHDKDESIEAFCRKHGFSGPHVHPNTEKPGKLMSDWLYERSDDYSSLVYWYQGLTGKPLAPLPARDQRTADIALTPAEQKK